MRKQMIQVATVLILYGVGLNFAPRPSQVERSRSEIENMLPVNLTGFITELEPGKAVSYELGDDVYKTLHPWAIVARVFSKEAEQFDVVAIASRSKESFHDPQVCFTAQGWNLTNQRLSAVETTSRGIVPVTLVDMEQNGEKKLALYFFRTTQGYFGDIHQVKLKMMLYKFKNFGKDDEGAFIRVIPVMNANEESLKKFTALWIDSAVKTSNGYY